MTMAGIRWKACLAAAMAALMLLGGGCGGGKEQPAPAPSQEAEEAEPLGEGRFLAGGKSLLNQQQRELLLGFFQWWYGALARLEVGGMEDLFALPGQEERDEATLTYLIGVREMQRTDLSLAGFSYTLDCLEAEEQEDGSLRVLLSLDDVQNFSAHPQVDSRTYGAQHLFVLEEGEAGWRIRAHRQLGSLGWLLSPGGGDALAVGEGPQDWREQEEPGWDYRLRSQELLEEALQYTTQRGSEDPIPAGEAQNPYDRQAAVEYARAWVGQRSSQWPAYDQYGGNCQNFVSQCLLAGGIPMDTAGDHIWKWYGEAPSVTAGTWGRSASWSAVGDFREYAAGNQGDWGLQAGVDAPYFSGQPGDILQMGPAPGDLRHTVLITGLVTDQEGKTVDYLVASNTADLTDFPAGAYAYPCQSLIRVWGWNGEEPEESGV